MREQGTVNGEQRATIAEQPYRSLFPLPCSPARWNLILDPTPRSGPENMALDYGLLQAVGDDAAFLRLYSWSPGCLSFGRNEPAGRRYDRALIEKQGLGTVRRPTGGRVVWHEHELTYALAADVSAFGSLRKAYCAIHQMLIAALGKLGIDATLAPRPTRQPGLEAGACFASPAGGEVMVRGRKLVGSAQVRHRHAFLQHGSILLDGGQDLVDAVTVGSGPAPAVRAITLRECAGRPVDATRVALAVAQSAREAWGGSWCRAERDPDAGLVARFADPARTWAE